MKKYFNNDSFNNKKEVQKWAKKCANFVKRILLTNWLYAYSQVATVKVI
jgi:hypothetical protein